MREPRAGNVHALESPSLNLAQSLSGGTGMSFSLSDRVALQWTAMGELPDQIRKLERQLKAAHNSITARDQKLEEVREENRRCVGQRPVVLLDMFVTP